MSRCWTCEAPVAPDPALGELGFVRCSACGFVFRPDLDGAAAATYEEGAYDEARSDLYADDQELEDRRRDARLRVALVREHAEPGRLLDVGAAGGAFVLEAGAAGFDATGLEPTPGFARYARERLGVDVRDGTLEDAALEPDALDVVTMWHVLEHVPRPVEGLRLVRDALRPGGVLVLEVPNAGGLAARREGAAWGSLQPDVHVNQFSPGPLRLALENAGFDVADVHTVPVTPYLPAGARLGPRHVAMRAKVAIALRSPAGRHPDGHELLRAVARRPGVG